jgi:hypothetical protein
MALKAEMQKTVKSVGVQRSNRQDEGPLENVLDAITAPQLESLAVQVNLMLGVCAQCSRSRTLWVLGLQKK